MCQHVVHALVQRVASDAHRTGHRCHRRGNTRHHRLQVGLVPLPHDGPEGTVRALEDFDAAFQIGLLGGVFHGGHTVVVHVEDGVEVILLPAPLATVGKEGMLLRVGVLRVVVLRTDEQTVALVVEGLVFREVVAPLVIELRLSRGEDLTRRGRALQAEVRFDVVVRRVVVFGGQLLILAG